MHISQNTSDEVHKIWIGRVQISHFHKYIVLGVLFSRHNIYVQRPIMYHTARHQVKLTGCWSWSSSISFDESYKIIFDRQRDSDLKHSVVSMRQTDSEMFGSCQYASCTVLDAACEM